MKIQNLRRLYEAAGRDRNQAKFFDDLSEGFRTRQIKPEDFSIRELFEHFVDNGREMVDSWNPKHGGGVQLLEAGDAVNTAAFANISGQIVYNEMLMAFQLEDFVFTPLVRTVTTQFNGEKIAGIGGIGDEAAVIGEGMPYPNAGVSEDYIETPVTTKRGLIVPVTKEAVFFDRTNQLLEKCNEVGKYLGYNKEVRIVDAFIDENVTTHRYKWRGTVYASYQTSTPWDNTTASATLTDWTDIDEAEQTLAAILDPNTGLPILNMANDLVVTRQNLAKAMYIVNATQIRMGDGASNTTANYSAPIVQSKRIVSSSLLANRMATDTTWFLGNIRETVSYMQNWPLTVVSAPANSEAEFTHDIVQRYKASERGAAAVIEPRKTTKCTVA
jgi:hypothetical protein